MLKAMVSYVFTQSSAAETDWPLQLCCEKHIFFLFTWKWALLICESWWHFEGHTVVCRNHRGNDGTHASSRASLTEAGKRSLCLMGNVITWVLFACGVGALEVSLTWCPTLARLWTMLSYSSGSEDWRQLSLWSARAVSWHVLLFGLVCHTFKIWYSRDFPVPKSSLQERQS